MTRNEDQPRLADSTGYRRGARLPHPVHLRAGAIGLAAVAAALLLALRLVVDAPVTVPGVSAAALLGPATTATTGLLALSAITLGVTHDRVTAHAAVASIAIGVFGLLTLVSDAVVLPAVGVIVAGGALVLDAWAPRTRRSPAVLPAACLTGGLALTVTASAGLIPISGRTLGIPVVLLGFTLAPLAMSTRDRGDLSAGAAVGLVIVALGLAAPFVTAASSVAVLGVAGVPVVLLASATGGLTATASAARTTGSRTPFAGVVLLAAAGAPVSIARALALVLGGALVLGTLRRDEEVRWDE